MSTDPDSRSHSNQEDQVPQQGKRSLLKRIISNPVVQTFLLYVSGGWIVLEMTDFLINNYNLNDRIRDVLLIVFVAGLPVIILIAWWLGRERKTAGQKSVASDEEKRERGHRSLKHRRPLFYVSAAVVLLLLIAAVVRTIHRSVKVYWARTKAITELEAYFQSYDFIKAYEIYKQARKFLPEDPGLNEFDVVVCKFAILSDPEGVNVFYKPYADIDGEWQLAGTTPVKQYEIPNYTLYRWKFEKPGYDTVFAVAPTHMDTIFRTLHRTGTIPEGMVYVEGLYGETSHDLLSKKKHGFFIDKYEVTNQQFKEFVDRGGYSDPSYWKVPFVFEGDTLSFHEAIEHFRDASGRPGPASWEAGDYPDGENQYPVSGISWYEAVAFCEFTGKSLPTFWHWRSASGNEIKQYTDFIGSNLIPLSNFGGSGPEPVGSNTGMNCFGTYDMAGNVREWCWNLAPTERAVFGGAWNDVSYMSHSRSQVPPFDRSPKNGFRCVVYPEPDSVPEDAFQPVLLWGQRDYYAERPVSDIEFEVYRKLFQYDKIPLNSMVESTDDSHEDWIVEKVSFDAAYEETRMIAYLFLPREYTPPFQTVIFFPGAYALDEFSLEGSFFSDWNIDYIIKNGRAVMFPIYEGTYERRDSPCNPEPPGESHQFTECLVKWVKDFSRSIDYLDSRDDIAMDKLAFLGDSWGGYIGFIVSAVEERIKASILIRGGLLSWKRLPEAEEFNYVSHVTIPTLMLSGRYDPLFPYESSVKPGFDLLGTPDDQKKLCLYDTDHWVPKTEMIREVLNWLDTYLGPVNK